MYVNIYTVRDRKTDRKKEIHTYTHTGEKYLERVSSSDLFLPKSFIHFKALN